MALLDVRLRAGYLFLAVVIAHIVLISAQVNAKTGVPILETVTFGAFAEVQRATSAVLNGFRGAWTGYVALRNVRSENEALRDLANARSSPAPARARRRTAASKRSSSDNSSELPASAEQINGEASSPDCRTVTIDKGSVHQLRADMAVLAPTGVVGRVGIAGPRASRVQLLVDRNAAAGALIVRSRAQGVVVGAGDDRLRLDYVSETQDVAVGDTVVTSGIDGIYPKGFVIGRVESVDKNGVAYRSIGIRPAVDFSTLEDVLVVLTPSPAQQAGAEKP